MGYVWESLGNPTDRVYSRFTSSRRDPHQKYLCQYCDYSMDQEQSLSKTDAG